MCCKTEPILDIQNKIFCDDSSTVFSNFSCLFLKLGHVSFCFVSHILHYYVLFWYLSGNIHLLFFDMKETYFFLHFIFENTFYFYFAGNVFSRFIYFLTSNDYRFNNYHWMWDVCLLFIESLWMHLSFNIHFQNINSFWCNLNVNIVDIIDIDKLLIY